MQAMMNKDGMRISAYISIKNWLTKIYVTKDLFGTLALVNVNVINHMILKNI